MTNDYRPRAVIIEELSLEQSLGLQGAKKVLN